MRLTRRFGTPMKLAQNFDGTWAVVDDEGSVLVSGLRTHAAVQQWMERQDLPPFDHEAAAHGVMTALGEF